MSPRFPTLFYECTVQFSVILLPQSCLLLPAQRLFFFTHSVDKRCSFDIMKPLGAIGAS